MHEERENFVTLSDVYCEVPWITVLDMFADIAKGNYAEAYFTPMNSLVSETNAG